MQVLPRIITLRWRAPAIFVTALLVAGLFPLAPIVRAAVSVTAATGGGAISADTAGGTYTALTGPSISGTAGSDLAAWSLTLTIPSGFAYEPGFGAAALSGAGCGTLALGAVTVTATTVSLTTTGASSGACTITFSNLRVRPTAGTPSRSPPE